MNILNKNTIHIIKKKPVVFFILPSFIGVTIFFILPYIDVLRRAFFNSTGKRFVGLDNFNEIFSNEAFQLAIKNTGLFMLVCIPILMVSSLFIAVFIYKYSGIGSYLKTGFLVPLAMPTVAVVLLWKILFDKQGLLNGGLGIFGIESIEWMNSQWAFFVMVFSYIWKNIGYNIVLWIAGLSMISESIYEAARLDGATEKQIFFKMTIPNLTPMIFIISILAIINSFKVFREAYLIAGDYPHKSMYMLQHLFNNWFRDLSLDKMATGAVLLSVVLVIMVYILRKAWENRE